MRHARFRSAIRSRPGLLRSGLRQLDSLPQSVARRPCSSPMGTPLPRDACGVLQNRRRRWWTHELKGEAGMADRRYGGISLGGILVIVGIAFGGFARGKWY